MISTTTLILIVAALLIAFVLLAGLAATIYFFYSRLTAFIAVLQAFVDAVNKLGKVAEGLADVPKFISGHAKAAQAMSVQVGRLVTSVAAFEKLTLSPTSQTGRDALTVPTEDEANKFYFESLFRSEGKTPDEAEQMAADEIMKQANMPLSMD